jgi:hypothetical protein
MKSALSIQQSAFSPERTGWSDYPESNKSQDTLAP